MEFWKFMLFSFFEWFALIVFMLALFRVDFRKKLPETIYLSLAMSFFSYVLRSQGWQEYAPFVQVILFVIIVCLLLRFHWLHGIVVGVVGYQAYSIWQGIISLILIRFFPDTKFQYGEPSSIVVVTICVVVFVGSGILIRRKGWGFTFVKPKHKGKPVITGHNLAFMVFSFLGMFILGAVWFFFNYRQMEFFLLFSVIHLLMLIGLVYLSVKKDKEKESAAKSGETVSG